MLVVKTKLRETAKRGIGLFASTLIPKGQIVWILDKRFNKVFKPKDLENLGLLEKAFIETYGVNEKNGNVLLDLDNARFMNHSDKPNIKCNEDCCIAIEDIKIDDEILCNYKEFDHEIASKDSLGFTNLEDK